MIYNIIYQLNHLRSFCPSLYEVVAQGDEVSLVQLHFQVLLTGSSHQKWSRTPKKLSPMWGSGLGRLEMQKDSVASKIVDHQLNHLRSFCPSLYEVVAQGDEVSLVQLHFQVLLTGSSHQKWSRTPKKLSPSLSPDYP